VDLLFLFNEKLNIKSPVSTASVAIINEPSKDELLMTIMLSLVPWSQPQALSVVCWSLRPGLASVAKLNAQPGIYELNSQLLRVFDKTGEHWRFRA
jgi:hypothetical protein